LRGFVDREERIVKEDWEQTRIIVGYLANQNARHPKAFNKILPLPWDEDKAGPTEETIERLKQHMEEENKKITDGK